jgi:hypothetical protein
MRRTFVLACLGLAACGTQYSSEPSLVASGVVDVDASTTRVCWVTSGSAVMCEGAPLIEPEDGGTPPPLDLPPAMLVTVGNAHACAAHVAGVTCWGMLNEQEVLEPVAVIGVSEVTALDAGAGVTCGIDEDDGTVFCWSADGVAAPLSTAAGVPLVATSISLGGLRGCAIDPTGQLLCWGGTWGAAPAVVDVGPIVDVAVSRDHACWVHANGKVICVGEDLNGESGDLERALTCRSRPCIAPETVVSVPGAVDAGTGGRHSCSIDGAGTVYCWGSNELGQLGRDDAFLVGGPGRVGGLDAAVDVVGGTAHTCALTAGGDLYCWGIDLVELANGVCS